MEVFSRSTENEPFVIFQNIPVVTYKQQYTSSGRLLWIRKKVIENLFFSDNDHKLYLMGQKNTFSDHFFSKEALSEE